MPLSRATLFAYALPGIGFGSLDLLFMAFLLKFCTDALGIAPALISLVLAGGRFWDAISDPVVGYLSDATISDRFGRRRLWMLASALPLGVSFAAVFSPPAALTEDLPLTAWMAATLFFYYTTHTCFRVPQLALGVELSEQHGYSERTRLMGWRVCGEVLGQVAGVGALALLMGSDHQRSVAAYVATFQGGLTAACILVSVLLLVEVPGRHIATRRNPLELAKVVLSTSHARIFTAVVLLHEGSRSSFALLAPYAVQYALKLSPKEVAPIMGASIGVSLLSIPIWVRLAQRYGKIPTFYYSIIFFAAAFTTTLPVAWSGFGALPEWSRRAIGYFSAMLVGAFSSAKPPLGDSIAGDVIDYEQSITGEGKHGTFFAFWNFCTKTVGGLITIPTGVLLQMAGFVPNQREQKQSVVLVILFLFAILPMCGLVIAAAVFRRFELGEEEHAQALKAIEKHRTSPKNGEAPSPGSPQPTFLSKVWRMLPIPRFLTRRRDGNGQETEQLL